MYSARQLARGVLTALFLVALFSIANPNLDPFAAGVIGGVGGLLGTIAFKEKT